MTSMTRRRSIVISTVVLAVASAVVGVIVLASRPVSSAMPGMDHGSGVAPASSQATTSSEDMPGMDMPAMDMTESTPTPTMSGDMPGMDHGSGEMPGSSPTPTSTGGMPGMDMPGMDHDAPETDHGSSDMSEMDHEAGNAAAAVPDRPLAPVLGTFGGGTSAVLLTASFLRRKDRAASEAKKATRAASRTRK